MSAIRELIARYASYVEANLTLAAAAEAELKELHDDFEDLNARYGDVNQALAERDRRDEQLLTVVEGMHCAAKDFGEDDPHLPEECPMCALEIWVNGGRESATPPAAPRVEGGPCLSLNRKDPKLCVDGQTRYPVCMLGQGHEGEHFSGGSTWEEATP